MKFNFKIQQYQTDAVDAVVKVFAGQGFHEGIHYIRDLGVRPQAPAEPLFTEPEHCHALPEAISAIREADLIILGPGSLFTSVIPNLLIPEISHEIAKSKAKKIYVCNIMTQPGETDGFSVSDHLNALIKHAGSKKIVDTVLVNDFMPSNLAQKYQMSGSYPVKVDFDNLKKLGIKVFSRKLIEDNKEGFVRHSSNRVARAIYYWFRKEHKQDKGVFFSSHKDTEKQGCNV